MFENKVVWITGASSGIGEELAVQLSKGKAWLILSARRQDELERVQNLCLQHSEKVDVFPFDLSDLASLKNISEQVLYIHGRIDMLIHSGGISQRSNAQDTKEEVEQRIMNINFFAAIKLTKSVLPDMIKNNMGKIVVISSVTGKIGVPQRSIYSASKHALIGYFDSLRAELVKQKHNIQIHIICPGFIHTNISYNAVKGDGISQKIVDPGQAKGMTVEVCVRKIIVAIKKNKNEVLIGGKEIWMARIRRFFPSLYYKLITKVETK
ncbi:MAG: SDR family oxidoreductase [Chitinophagales bacterium]